MSRRKVRLSILTISDRCSQGLALDSSGRTLKDLATASTFAVVSRYAIVPDDEDKIKVSCHQPNYLKINTYTSKNVSEHWQSGPPR